ncbi:hypothetical protein [Streptomyces daliensis]
MTANKDFKHLARRLAASEGISYAAAQRRLLERPADDDGSADPDAVCRFWMPEDAKGVPYEVRQAATLPTGRAYQVAVRYEEPSSIAFPDRWLLALVYAMLADQRPDLLPGREDLRSAVESGDQAAVDAVMDPLDRAAARLLTKEADHWWSEVKPRLDSYADAVEADDRHQVGRLVEQWRRAWTKARNSNGYYDAPGVLWHAPKHWLDALLVDRHGGHLARVRLVDGRPAFVYAAEWGEAGPPLAYRVREMEPGRYGNAGKLIPKLSGGELVDAEDCRDDGPCLVCGGEAGMTEGLCEGCTSRQP